MKSINYAQIHRHNGRVVLWLEGQETVYLTSNQARGISAALKACAKDIATVSTESNSQFKTVRIES